MARLKPCPFKTGGTKALMDQAVKEADQIVVVILCF
jgi:hypothetical protein